MAEGRLDEDEAVIVWLPEVGVASRVEWKEDEAMVGV